MGKVHSIEIASTSKVIPATQSEHYLPFLPVARQYNDLFGLLLVFSVVKPVALHCVALRHGGVIFALCLHYWQDIYQR